MSTHNHSITPTNPPSQAPVQDAPGTKRILFRGSAAGLALKIVIADNDLPNHPELQGAIGSALHDIMRFAKGEITRKDLDDGVQAACLWINEIQEVCPVCKGAQGTFKDCRNCDGRGWLWPLAR